jgi:uncharacterized protein (TIGR03382 family)
MLRIGLTAAIGCALLACDTLDVGFDVEEIRSEDVPGSEIAGASKNGVAKLDVVLPPDDEGDSQDPIVCSAIVVAPDLLLTSARCVNENLEAPGTLDNITVGFGNDGNTAVQNGVAAVELHRYFDKDNPNLFQLAFVQLTAPAPDAPRAINAAAIDDLAGEMVELVGYGETANDMGNFQRRAVTLPISVVEREAIRVGDDTTSNCAGDSGGPVLDMAGDVIAVSRRQNSCSQTVSMTRTDRNTADFIFPYIDQKTGPCRAGDGTCETVDCRTPDPDCPDNGCLWGNTCVEDCPTRDWDCPIGSFPGQECAIDGECEQGGRCVAALDDADFLYCNKPCEVDEDCPQNMTCNAESECEFGTPSPGSQGFACTQNDQCRSGICEDLICVFECDPAANDCPDPFLCGPSKVASGTNVCLGEDLSGGGGFCQAGSSRGAGTTALLLVIALLWIRRRRRSA